MARQWRSSCKARAEKIGLVLPSMPSIDEVEAHLKAQLSAGQTCCYCGARFGAGKRTKPNMDHRVPISRGGDANITNLAICCRACNAAKGPLLESEYRQLLACVGNWADGGWSLLVRLRGGYWCYRDVPLDPHKGNLSTT